MPDGWGSQWRGGESEEGEERRGRVVKGAIDNDLHGDAPPLKNNSINQGGGIQIKVEGVGGGSCGG